MADWIEQTGLVLFVEDYPACVKFYRDILGLSVFADQGFLTVFRFGTGYLMVEPHGVASASRKSRAQSPVTLRFNVADVEREAERLRTMGTAVSVEQFEWGTVGKFTDPDGNPCELRNHFDGFFAPVKT
jgi:lactoylglutathione lyase